MTPRARGAAGVNVTALAIAWTAGVAALQLQPALPPLATWALLPGAMALAWLRPRAASLLALALGFFWAAAFAQARMAEWLAPALEGRDIEVQGVVASLPAVGERSVRFELEVEEAASLLPRKLLLNWYADGASRPRYADGASRSTSGPPAVPDVPSVQPGERWRLVVRLRRPHGNVNAHGFDYEAWLLERGIGATGYVRPGGHERLGLRRGVGDAIERARAAVRERYFAILGETPAAGILAALAVGDQGAIAAEEWRLFAGTGVTHLMSISGLHVTLVSGLLAWLASGLWRRVPALALRLPARRAGALAAIAGALGYTVLAGFAIPAQRTLYMVSAVALAVWFGRIASPLRVLALALAAVVAGDPWAPLAPGFWLSFGAVALIFYVGTGWSRPDPWWIQFPRVQWSITVGLAPAIVLLFGQVPMAGPLANALAIPLVSAVITPLALLAAIVPAEALLHGAAWLVEWLLRFLEWCASLPGALWHPVRPSPWALALAIGGIAWMLAPRGVPWRLAGAALLAPAFAAPAPAPAHGQAWITVLDVGQGLAVLVQTASRTLLYDAGPAYGPELDSGGRIVVPWLQAHGIGTLDAVFLSHEDGDHIGGAGTVLESVEVAALYSSLPPSHTLHVLAPRSHGCAAGMAWDWDGVGFEVLHPGPRSPARRNDRSCVLRIDAGGARALVTGDIERAGEVALLAGGARLDADVIIVPHHGSRTSSTAGFVSAVRPRWAIAAAGYRNRFGHPHPEVVARYAAAGATILRTDRDGAVRVELAPPGGTQGVSVTSERARRPRYWRTAPVG